MPRGVYVRTNEYRQKQSLSHLGKKRFPYSWGKTDIERFFEKVRITDNRGHLLEGKNLYIRKDGKGRECKLCRFIAMSKYIKEKERGLL